MNAGKRSLIGVWVAVAVLASPRAHARGGVEEPEGASPGETPAPVDALGEDARRDAVLPEEDAELAPVGEDAVLERRQPGTFEAAVAEEPVVEVVEATAVPGESTDRTAVPDVVEVTAARPEPTALPRAAHVDAPARGSVHRRRVIAGASLVTLGIAAAGAGIGLAATSLSLDFPSGCDDVDPLTPCTVGVAVSGTRLGAGVSTGVGAAVLMGIGVGMLVRTPKGDALEIPRARRIATRVTGAVGIAGGVGMVVGAAVIAVQASQAYAAAGALEESVMRGAVRRANAVLALGVGGLVVVGTSAGLIAAPRTGRGRIAGVGGPVVGFGYVGWSISGRVPW